MFCPIATKAYIAKYPKIGELTFALVFKQFMCVNVVLFLLLLLNNVIYCTHKENNVI